jgi:hypothetical protein
VAYRCVSIPPLPPPFPPPLFLREWRAKLITKGVPYTPTCYKE